MKLLIVIFFPVLLIIYLLHQLILFLRNKLYDYNILKSHKFKHLNIISIGSLKFGGAGKTPLVEYIINHLSQTKIAVLSRGYKRKKSGFIIAKKHHTAFDIGDELNMISKKNKNLVVVADKNRQRAIKKIIEKNNIKTIILDDAHQYRKLKKNLNIIVTEYNKLYSDDYLFPLGKLRESCLGAKRAEIIVVTKCPKNITKKNKNVIRKKLALNKTQKIFFSYIKSYKFINNNKIITLESTKKYFLVTGIANPDLLIQKLQKISIKFMNFNYHDHHYFTKKEIENLITKAKKNKIDNLIITEKDYYRFSKEHLHLIQSHFFLIYTQIEFDFINEEKLIFNKQLTKFI